ncbi:MAG: triose-phosphate isomerase [Dethiobacteria bacterium]|jgi:triosephosphate isomerase|nr:triose-phosphate isomerase [Bacillota bacterium]NMD33813.1 triose-phosphate isomerase [Bacillota bacterium]
MGLIIAANWKMHKTAAETVSFCNRLLPQEKYFQGIEVLICPPFTALAAAAAALEGSSIKLGAQNMSWEEEGAYTGEIAPQMLKEFRVSHVILGHSERRHIFGEDDATIRKKFQRALYDELVPILCIGETEDQRNRGETEAVLERQLRAVLEGLEPGSIKELVVAYEPVWAIGTGRAASPSDAAAAASLVRAVVEKIFSSETGPTLRVQYGGSVNANNIGSFVALSPVNGALVGGASLEVDSFAALITAAKEAAGC